MSYLLIGAIHELHWSIRGWGEGQLKANICQQGEGGVKVLIAISYKQAGAELCQAQFKLG